MLGNKTESIIGSAYCFLDLGDFVEVVEAFLRPCFQAVTDPPQLFRCHEGHLRNHLLTFFDLRFFQIPKMNDAEMDLPDFVRIVIEKGDNIISMIRLYGNFFGDLPLDGGEIIIVSVGE